MGAGYTETPTQEQLSTNAWSLALIENPVAIRLTWGDVRADA
jgi:hypothetical protein